MSTHAPDKGLTRLSFPILIATAVAGLLTLATCAQDDGQVYRILKVGEQETMSGYLTCWLDLSPDNSTIGLSATQGFPYRRFPVDQELNVQEMDIGNWYAGSRARYSRSGRYIVLSSSSTWTTPPTRTGPSNTRWWTWPQARRSSPWTICMRPP